MTDKLPSADERLQDREDSPTPLDNVGRAEAARASAGTIAVPAPASASTADMELAYESGVELKARSQWAYARMRFFRHRLAVVSLFVLILIGLIAIFAKHVAPTASTTRTTSTSRRGRRGITPSGRTCSGATT